MWAASNGRIEVVKMLLDRNANIEAVDNNVSRNVIIACTALCIIPIIMMMIIIIFVIMIILIIAIIIVSIKILSLLSDFSYCQYYNIILRIMSLYSYSINHQDIFYYVVVVKLCVMMMYIDNYSDNNLVYLWCHIISHVTLYYI